MAMRIRQIPILSDNYVYLIIDDASRVCAAVDPAEPLPVLEAVAQEGVQLTHVLCTHHHWDHAGGNEVIAQSVPGVNIVAGRTDAERIAGVTKLVDDGDTVRVGTLEGQVILVPCHTSGHVAYLFGDALFSGDTLFVGGCGRFFEGDAGQMYRALIERFAALPGDTRVFCGHEYTVSNLRFAASVEPDNEAIARKLEWAEARIQAGDSTVPSTIAEELATNPFMRVNEAAVRAAMRANDGVEAMHRLREAKNAF